MRKRKEKPEKKDGLEIIVMECQDQQKVLFATDILVDEAKYWWENTRPCLEGAGGTTVQ